MPKITKLRLHLLKLFTENYWLLFSGYGKNWLLFSGHGVYRCPENFRESLAIRPRLLFPEFLMGLCCDRSYMKVRTKFEVRSFNRS